VTFPVTTKEAALGAVDQGGFSVIPHRLFSPAETVQADATRGRRDRQNYGQQVRFLPSARITFEYSFKPL
jgi:hypothetical protein